MPKKKISFKLAADLRKPENKKIGEVEAAIDKWVNSETIKDSPISLTRLNVNIPTELHKKLKAYCAENGRKVTDLILELIRNELPGK